ncbi:MAG: DUF5749 family beta-barrel protein [Thermoplasmatota archaeon]
MPRKKSIPELSDAEAKDFRDDMLSLFVRDDGGKVVGETIGFDGNHLILKMEDRFFKIPISAVEKAEGSLVVKKRIDWKKAGKMGEKWRKKELDPLY